MADPLSGEQIERLGKRLVADADPAPADMQLLRELLLTRSHVLEEAIARVHDGIRLSPSSRIKNTGTILEKLRRKGGWGLKSMQDLAGMRVVGEFDRRGQDDVVASVCALFADELRAPKVIDRRVSPMHGYAAVHVVVFPDGVPIEIQIRTSWQHEWAELFEKLADRVGRGIRYGEPPTKWWTAEEFNAMSATRRRIVALEYEIRETLVEHALVIADMVDAVERAEAVNPDAAELSGFRGRVEDGLSAFRRKVEGLDRSR